MATFLFRCPNTGFQVQGWIVDKEDESANRGDSYEAIECLACRQVHFVNPTTGKTLGLDE
jgi:hypothetical protein